MLRITPWVEELIPGNYTILVNMTNSALVERTFFININVPFPDFDPFPVKNTTHQGLFVGPHTPV